MTWEPPVQQCCAEPFGLRSGVKHNRICTVPLRADKTHDGQHRNRGGEEWANTCLPIVVPERRGPSR